MRAAAFLLALGLLTLIWGGLLTARLGDGFAAHMLRHMTLVALVPPLLLWARPGLAARLAPNAALAPALDFALVWGWHLPVLHDAVRVQPGLFALEQASFLLAGLAVWAGALGARSPLLGAGTLLLTTMHMTLLGALIVLAPRLLYATCGSLADQQTGGLIMLGIGTPVYLIAGLALTGRALTLRETPA
ncbi:cytochrome c oxidase assembly protein [Roseivivax sp. CAU 1761]